MQGPASGGTTPANISAGGNLKAYSNRGALTRVPSQIINPAAVAMRESSGHQRIDESYEGSKNKYKIEY